MADRYMHRAKALPASQQVIALPSGMVTGKGTPIDRNVLGEQGQHRRARGIR